MNQDQEIDTSVTGRQSVIEWLPERRVTDQSVVRIASSSAFVRASAEIHDVYDSLNAEPSLQAVAVVDAEDTVLGIVVRRDFFATMARPYAQDVFRNLPVTEVMTIARTFSGDSDIFTVSDDIAEEMREPTVQYYLLTWSGQRFGGIFSSQDMLVYLSQITQKDIELARKLQSRIVREREIAVGARLELVASSHTAKGVGGDFYKTTQYAPGKWIVTVCDVSGKGVAASIITSVLWGMMSIYDFTQGVVPFIRQLNDYLVQTFETEKFVTAVFLDYDETAGTVTICDMGHSHIFLYRNHMLHALKTKQNNLPLGIVTGIEPKTDVFRPRETDLLFLITDGLIEQPDEQGVMYSLSRVTEILREFENAPVESISDRIFKDFNQFRGRRPLGDDITWSLMRFNEQTVIL